MNIKNKQSNMPQMKTDIVFRTCIKPSSPTTPNRKTFKLSLLDQLSPAVHINITFFFPSDAATTSVADPDLEFSRKSQPGPAPRVGLPKPVPILVSPLLLNIKKQQHKSPSFFFFFMPNQGYIVLLAYII
jgi:hypothetical protein